MPAVNKGRQALEEIPNVDKVWRAPSGSRAGVYHYVVLHKDGELVCICEGSRYRGDCWHLQVVRELLHEEDEGIDVSL